jgi:transposase-like protein
MLLTEVTMGRRRGNRKALGRGPAAATKADGVGEPGRFSARRKTETILRLLRGEPLDGVARELGVTAATLAQWREYFLAGGQAALKSRLADDRDEEIQRLRAKVGEITMNHELLLDRCHRLEAGLPLALRRRSE